MTKGEKNSKAYQDAANYAEPSMPDDEEYMSFYRGWRNLSLRPDDQYGDRVC
jgi:hypothetical protein